MTMDFSGLRGLFQEAVLKATVGVLEHGRLGKHVVGSPTIIFVRGRAGRVFVTRRDQTFVEATVKGYIVYEEDYPVEFRLEHGDYVIQGKSVHPSLPTVPIGIPEIISYADLMAMGVAPLYNKIPDTPHAKNDEFNDESIDADWTQYGPAGTPFATWSEKPDHALYFKMPVKSDWGVDALVKAPPAGDFTFTVAIRSWTGARVTTNIPAMLCLMQGNATQAAHLYGQRIVGPDILLVKASNLDTLTTTASSVNTNGIQRILLRFQKASTTWTFSYSTEGYQWISTATLTEPWTIANIGMAGGPENANQPVGAVYEWARFNWTLGD